MSCSAIAEVQPRLNVMPMPASVQMGTGQLPIDRTFSVTVTGFHDAMLDGRVERFKDQLSRRTGLLLQKPVDPSHPTLSVHADHASEKVQKVGEDESYELTISTTGAKLTAPNTLGILHGLETFLQLITITPTGFSAPAVSIHDQPRFVWRGTLIDVGRHFIPIDVLKRNIDGMAAVKMNVLHWHLYDSEGFRIESKRFPKLQGEGSDGRFYTQEEIRDFIAYAHDRGVRIMPEFEMPGHSRSMYVGYPELASGSGPYKMEPGAPDAEMDVTKEETYKFLDKFLEEMATLFPDEYVHIGGDEVAGKEWEANPKIQAFMREHGMKNKQDLQAYFNQRLQKIVSKHRKIMVGWDEVLHPDLPKSVVVQSWRGQESLATAAQQGYRGILSFGYYLDLMWPAARHYAVEPLSGQGASLNAEEKARILGGESCMWAEFITPENIDSRIWPRNAAIAERLWSPASVQDPASMYERMAQVSERLELLGLTHRTSLAPALDRMAGGEDVSALRTLADVVEPVKDYTRMDNAKGPLDFRAPLNRLIDTARPESDQARRFHDAVQAYITSGHKDRAAEATIRSRLTAWRDNDARLHPMLEESFLMEELGPLSADLSSLGFAGLFALDYLERGTSSPTPWRTQQLTALDAAAAPHGDLLIMVAGPVRQLVEASGTVRPGP
ncbi:MAG TPA: beta-N-acetylhexosaminidase [Terriglobales bacterium]|nr:beta-N-acetylhexosaminidase [Terriglobales bacterium]